MSYTCTHKVRTNQTETTYRIELSGGTGELVGTGDIFNLEYERIDPTQPYSVPLQSGRLEFNILVRDSGDLALLQTIFAEAEGTRTLSLYQDNQLIFKGVVLSDLLEYPEADYPFEGKIIAKDLTALKGYNYTLNNDRKTIISVIAEILDILNYGYTIDAFTNWSQDNITDNSNFLGQIYMDSSSLREFRNQSENDTANPDGSYDLPLNAYDALELILRNFGLILRQANGKWKIYQLSALTGDTVSGQSYTSAGVASGTLSETLTESIDKSTRYILPGSINTFNPALKKVGVNFNHRTRESETEIPRRITFSNTINQVLDPREYEFQFISETITSDSGRGTIYEEGPYITIKGSAKASVAPSASITSRDIFYFPIQVKIETLTKTYYLQDNDSWDTTVNTRYVRSTGRSAYGGRLHDNGTFDIESSITPDDADGILTVSVFQAQLTRPSKYLDTTPGQTTAQDFPNTFATSSSYDIEFEIVQTDDYSGSDSVQYEMTQDGNFSVEYDHGITYFGDGPQFFSPSALRYGTADKEVTNNDWGFVGGTKDQLLHELLLKEILFTQSETTRNLSAQLLGKFNPQNRLVFDSQKFFFLGGRLTGNNLWTANFLSLGFNTQTVNFSQIFASPSGELGAGVSTLYLANRSASFEEKQYITITSQSLTGTITSIPVVPTSIPVGKVGDPIYIFNIETGDVDEFTLSESYLIGATSFNVESGSVTGTAPEGSWIIYTGERLSSYITQTDNAITLGVRSADVALLSDDSIFTDESGNEYYFVEGDYTGQIIRSEALINIRADQILAQVSAIIGEDLTVLNDIVDDIAQLQTDVSQNDAAIDSLNTTVSGLPTAVEFAALESSLEINTDSILLGVREFSYALFDDDSEFITADGDTFAFVDNGDVIGLIRYNESLINVESDRIDLKVREIGSATAIGVLSSARSNGLTYTQILIDDRTLAQDISLRDGDNLRLFNDNGQSEQVTVNGDQTLTKGDSSIQTITIESKTLQYTYAAETSHLSFPGYQLGSEINVLKDEIVLKVDSNGDIAFIRLDGSADAGTEITINADQITVAGQTTFLSALGSEGFPTVSGINVTIRSATAPTIRTSGDALVTGDLWIETDNGDKPYTWNGTAWVAQYTVIDGGNITTGTIDAARIDVSGVISAGSIIVQTDLDTAIEGVNVTIRSDSTPTQRPDTTDLQVGDLWIDTNDGDKPYTYNGTSFVASYTSIDGGNIITGTVTATQIDVADLFAEDIAFTGTIRGNDGTNYLDIEPGAIYLADGAATGGDIANANDVNQLILTRDILFAYQTESLEFSNYKFSFDAITTTGNTPGTLSITSEYIDSGGTDTTVEMKLGQVTSINGTNKRSINMGLPVKMGEFDATSNATIGGTLQSAGYKSSDGSTGLTQTIAITESGGTEHTLVFKNGLLTQYTLA